MQSESELFHEELLELVETLEASLLALEAVDTGARADPERVGEAFRAAHNIKAAAAMIALPAAVDAAHLMESVLDEIRSGGAFDRSTITRLLGGVDVLRTLTRRSEASEDAERALLAELERIELPVPHVAPGPTLQTPPSEEPGARIEGRDTLVVGVRRVDMLVDLAAEMSVAVGHLEQLRGQAVATTDARMDAACREVKRLASRLQEAAMAIRLVPLAATFAMLRRFVRDQALRLGKSVVVELVGAQTELDKSVAERLLDPLKHLVRNALDHGIETPAERARAGKPLLGHLALSARQEQGEVILVVEDDGRGLDPERIREAALRTGAIKPEDALSAAEVLGLVFLPGFSTAERVGELSGRGVGLDVVRRNVLELGGATHVDSRPGLGARFSLTVPLTLAVLEGLVLRCGEERLVVPIDRVERLLRPAPGQIAKLPDGREILRLPELSAPILRLSHLFGADASREGKDAIAVVVDTAGGPVAFHVDEVLSQEAVMLKPLQRSLRVGREGVLGAAVLSDGAVALVLDVARLASFGGARGAPSPPHAHKT